MNKTFTASLLALSIGLTSITAAPAHAANEDQLGQFIAGAVALFILGKAIENGSERKTVTRKKTKKKYKKYRKPEVSRKRHPSTGFRKHRQHHVLPAQCGFPLRSRDGYREVFGKHCLEENARLSRLLPRSCKETVRIRHGRRSEVFDGECLRKFGYRVEARRY